MHSKEEIWLWDNGKPQRKIADVVDYSFEQDPFSSPSGPGLQNNCGNITVLDFEQAFQIFNCKDPVCILSTGEKFRFTAPSWAAPETSLSIQNIRPI